MSSNKGGLMRPWLGDIDRAVAYGFNDNPISAEHLASHIWEHMQEEVTQGATLSENLILVAIEDWIQKNLDPEDRTN